MVLKTDFTIQYFQYCVGTLCTLWRTKHDDERLNA